MPGPGKMCKVTHGGVLAVDARARVPWEDVWLRVHRRREPLRLAPCLISLTDLRGEIALYEEAGQDGSPFLEILVRLEREPFVIDPNSRRYGLADVYTQSAMIDRAEAERMLDFYLAAGGVSRPVRYLWERVDIFAMPLSPGEA